MSTVQRRRRPAPRRPPGRARSASGSSRRWTSPARPRPSRRRSGIARQLVGLPRAPARGPRLRGARARGAAPRLRRAHRAAHLAVPRRLAIACSGAGHRSAQGEGQVLERATSIALASRMAREVGEAQAAAEKAGKPLPTLSTDVEMRLRSPQDRAGLRRGAARGHREARRRSTTTTSTPTGAATASSSAPTRSAHPRRKP